MSAPPPPFRAGAKVKPQPNTPALGCLALCGLSFRPENALVSQSADILTALSGGGGLKFRVLSHLHIML